MWIVFGSGTKTARVPGGLKVERACGQCGERATFYEKEIISTFRLYFMDVFDYQRQRVMACGCCGACYATDELGARAAPARLEEKSAPLDQRIGSAVGRAATALEAGLSGLFRDDPPASSRPNEPAHPESDDEDDIDPLEHPMEARFRELEEKARQNNR